ncbi:16545_t:CDS:2 [Rhizophagus irregularis]|nr:16545_t:CDS:2 [Rhizophagus irregularis]
MEITKLENSNRELEVDVTVKERTNLEKEEEIRELEKKKEIDTNIPLRMQPHTIFEKGLHHSRPSMLTSYSTNGEQYQQKL